MLMQTSNSQRLYQQVANQIAELIESGKFSPGRRLPPERDLAIKYAVSRPTVREALVALEIAGMVEVRTGSGAYVSNTGVISKHRIKELDAGPSPFELITARRAIEPACAALAAQTAGKKDRVAMLDAFELNERLFGGSHWERLGADREFHLRIAEATHNARIVRMVTELWADMFGPIFAVLSERTEVVQKKALTMQDHRTILHCLDRRDPSGSEAAMLTHLVHAEIKLLRVHARSGASRKK
jgi:DNA-binding FadR family transcriptional regulator